MIYVKDVMSRRVRTIDSKAKVLDAAKRLSQWKIGSLVILAGDRPVGIITEGDVSKAVARGLNPAKTRVGFLSKKLITIGPDERLEDAAKTMAATGVKKLPVMEGGKLVGIITQTDIVGSSFDLVTSLKEMVRARYRPPDFQP
ncbi:MAG: CBS domain-containing protein [Nitrososphaerales archaeon]|nr:CBS domain-containing protein [Nitrososphaerales archaeon]